MGGRGRQMRHRARKITLGVVGCMATSRRGMDLLTIIMTRSMKRMNWTSWRKISLGNISDKRTF